LNGGTIKENQMNTLTQAEQDQVGADIRTVLEDNGYNVSQLILLDKKIHKSEWYTMYLSPTGARVIQDNASAIWEDCCFDEEWELLCEDVGFNLSLGVAD
jgi:hypothetical protein